jgi:hypothetical protein
MSSATEVTEITTVTLHVAVLPPSTVVTVMVAVPVPTAETRPEFETLATALLLLDQMTARFVALAGRTVATSWLVPGKVTVATVLSSPTLVTGTVEVAVVVPVGVVVAEVLPVPVLVEEAVRVLVAAVPVVVSVPVVVRVRLVVPVWVPDADGVTVTVDVPVVDPVRVLVEDRVLLLVSVRVPDPVWFAVAVRVLETVTVAVAVRLVVWLPVPEAEPELVVSKGVVRVLVDPPVVVAEALAEAEPVARAVLDEVALLLVVPASTVAAVTVPVSVPVWLR